MTPILALVVLGTFDLGRGYHLQIRLENAAREGGAYAQVHPGDVTCADDDDITDRVLDESHGFSTGPDVTVHVLKDDGTGDLTVPVTGCGESGIQPGDHVRVDATATYPVATPFVRRAIGSHITVTGSYEVVVHG